MNKITSITWKNVQKIEITRNYIPGIISKLEKTNLSITFTEENDYNPK